jgi:hypothetical protein
MENTFNHEARTSRRKRFLDDLVSGRLQGDTGDEMIKEALLKIQKKILKLTA